MMMMMNGKIAIALDWQKNKIKFCTCITIFCKFVAVAARLQRESA